MADSPLAELVSGYQQGQALQMQKAREITDRKLKQSQLDMENQRARQQLIQQNFENNLATLASNRANETLNLNQQKAGETERKNKADEEIKRQAEIGKNARQAARATIQAYGLNLRNKQHLDTIKSGLQKFYESNWVTGPEAQRRVMFDLDMLKLGLPEGSEDFTHFLTPFVGKDGTLALPEGAAPAAPTQDAVPGVGGSLPNSAAPAPPSAPINGIPYLQDLQGLAPSAQPPAQAPAAAGQSPALTPDQAQAFLQNLMSSQAQKQEQYGLPEDMALPKVQQQIQTAKAQEDNARSLIDLHKQRLKDLQAKAPYIQALEQSKIALNNSLAGMRAETKKKIIEETQRIAEERPYALKDLILRGEERKAQTANILARTQQIKENSGDLSSVGRNISNPNWVRSNGQRMQQMLSASDADVRATDADERQARNNLIQAQAMLRTPFTDPATGRPAQPGTPLHASWLKAIHAPANPADPGGNIWRDLTNSARNLTQIQEQGHRARANQWDIRKAMLGAGLITPVGDDGARLEHDRKAAEQAAGQKAQESQRAATAAQRRLTPPSNSPARRPAPQGAQPKVRTYNPRTGKFE